MRNRAASLLARLKNKSKEQGIPLQQLINLFCQEEFIRRLSQSPYKDHLILKGGFLLYAISSFTSRPTIDADYLLNDFSNDLKAIENLLEVVISEDSENDFVQFKIRGLEKITEMKEYHGIRVNLLGVIGKTKTPFSFDFGVGDIIVPSPIMRELPVIIQGFKNPKILTYSLESTIAEKLDAILSLMEATGRMKDFYDIYYLACHFDFDGRFLQTAISSTFKKRKRSYEKDAVRIIARLEQDSDIRKRWENFCKKVLRFELNFKDVLDIIIEFLEPPFEAIMIEEEFAKYWSSDKKYIEKNEREEKERGLKRDEGEQKQGVKRV